MSTKRLILTSIALLSLVTASMAQDRTTGGIKGKVRVETGGPAGVTVVISRRGQLPSMTDKSGSFLVQPTAAESMPHV